MRVSGHMRHVFVDGIPADVEPGTLYISIPYATAIHICCCGCGNEVVTPLSPTDWKLIFDGETVSLSPSIGNWSLDCQSHYWIELSRVRWARRMSMDEIEEGRARDREAKREYFGKRRQQRLNGMDEPLAKDAKDSSLKRK